MEERYMCMDVFVHKYVCVYTHKSVCTDMFIYIPWHLVYVCM